MHTSDPVEQYIHDVHQYLPNSSEALSDILSDLHQEMTEFCADKAAVSYADLVEHFGSPEQFSSSFLRNLPEEQSKGKSRRRKQILTFAIIITTFVLLFIFFFLHRDINSTIVSVGYSLEIETVPNP